MSPDGGAGTKYKNGIWTGLVGMLVKLQVDMVTIPLMLNKVRMEVIDYFIPFLQDRYVSHLPFHHS